MNNQATEKPDHATGIGLDVQEIFWTLQGEGPYGGLPAVFIRLAGCNLQCPGCDTDYTSKRRIQNVEDIHAQVNALFDLNQLPNRHERLVVLTGGEPFRQRIGLLCRTLVDGGYIVQIETNGTLHQTDFPYGMVCIVCSPKTPTISTAMPVNAYKYVLDARHVNPNDGLPTSVLGMQYAPARPYGSDHVVPIYLQPADEKDEAANLRNRDAVLASCMKFGYRFNLQVHKLLQLP